MRKPIGDAFLDFALQVELQFLIGLLTEVTAAKERAQAKGDGVQPMLWAHRNLPRRVLRSGLLESDDMRNGGGEAAPVGSLFYQMLAPKSCKRVILCAAIVFAGLPFGGDPAFLFELV
jgi:hypothetical protein